jgi:hypothetical protein
VSDERTALGFPLCWAGVQATFGGRWRQPCPNLGNNRIGDERTPNAAFLCTEHFEQVLAAGLIDEPFLSPEQFQAHYRKG